jgi:hypothetical protein
VLRPACFPLSASSPGIGAVEMENKLRENYVTSGEAIAANRVIDCIFRLLEQFEHEKGRPNPFTNNPPLPPSCSHLRRWASVHALRGAFVRLREALDKHKEALDEQVPEGELIKAECQWKTN